MKLSNEFENHRKRYLLQGEKLSMELLSEYPFHWIPPFQKDQINEDLNFFLDRIKKCEDWLKDNIPSTEYRSFDTRFMGSYNKFSRYIIFKDEHYMFMTAIALESV